MVQNYRGMNVRSFGTCIELTLPAGGGRDEDTGAGSVDSPVVSSWAPESMNEKPNRNTHTFA